MWVIEILLYRLRPGTGDAFFSIMENISVPLHRRAGIDVVWHGQSMHDPDAYGLVRAFPDLATLERQQTFFYASEEWRSGPREEIIERIEISTKLVIPMNVDGIEGMRKQGCFRNLNMA